MGPDQAPVPVGVRAIGCRRRPAPVFATALATFASARTKTGRTTPTRSALAVVLALVWSVFVTPGTTTAGSVLDLLQPAGRRCPELGGDPFRSPLEDAAGWWAEPSVLGPPSVRLHWEGADQIGDQTRNAELGASSTAVSASGSGRILGRAVRFGSRLARSQWSAGWSGVNGNASSRGIRPAATVAARASDLLPGLTLQVRGAAGTIGRSFQPTRSGIGLRMHRRILRIQGSVDRQVVAEDLAGGFHDETLSVPANLHRVNAAGDVALELPGRITAEGSMARSTMRGFRPRTPALTYHFAPDGWDDMQQASIAWRPGQVGVVARRSWRRASVRGDVSWGGTRFGTLSRARASVRSNLVGLEWTRKDTRWLVEAEAARADASGHARIEFWPFTPGLVDLIGPSRTYRMFGECEWTRIHAAREWSSGRSRWSAGVSWFDLTPEGSVESWRPAFLVFGRADVQEATLPYRRVQLAAVAAGAKVPLGPVEVEVALQQAVFAKAFRAGRAEEPAGPGPDDGNATNRKSGRRTPGGSFLSVGVSRGL